MWKGRLAASLGCTPEPARPDRPAGRRRSKRRRFCRRCYRPRLFFTSAFTEPRYTRCQRWRRCPFGQYAHSNQPVHHLLYIFAHAGRPDLTQWWARKVMQSLYTPDTFAGDEDTGSMSAWFVLSALGFYPVCPGKPEYTLGSPLFARSVVHVTAGVTFTIEAQGNAPDKVFVSRASLDGNTLAGNLIDHAAIMKGGTLRFRNGVQFDVCGEGWRFRLG